MSRSKSKTLSRQDIESAIEKVVQDQETYYATWFSSWSERVATSSETSAAGLVRARREMSRERVKAA